MCFSYKWLGDKKVHSVSITDYAARYKADPTDDYDVVRELHRLFNEADIIIAHNLNGFDYKVALGRMIAHDMKPPAPSAKVDTLNAYRRFTRFSSKALDKLGQQLELGRKTKAKYGDLWQGFLKQDKKSIQDMVKYCEQDVLLLEKLYLRIRPYISNHPNLTVITGMPDHCPKCNSGKMQRQGTRETNTYVYQRYQCQDCGGWGQFRLRDNDYAVPEFKSI